MGCGNSSAADVNQANKVNKPSDFNVSAVDLVGENLGIITNDYTLIMPPLGKGAFGEVRKAIHKISRQLRAIKIIKKSLASQDDIQRIYKEVNVLKGLDHPNIMKIYEYYQDQRSVYIVTELCQGGELFDKIIEDKYFSERKAAETMKQILGAINYCHQNNIMHRDLKPENILYETSNAGSQIKVVDFGTSIRYDPNNKQDEKSGTPYYIAPEVLDGQYNEKCDIWSLGVILYIMLCGTPPFNGEDDEQICKSVRNEKIQFLEEEWQGVSQQAREFIKKLLERDVSKRISAQEALQDDWITNYCKKSEVDLPSLKQSLTNMKKFKTQKKLQEASLMFMVNFLASKEEKNALLKQFQSLDTNNDGKLSRQELLQGFRKISNDEESVEEVDRIMKSIDKNGSEYIDYSEFVLATINKQNLLNEERLKITFQMLDKDGSNTITIDEIKNMFGSKNFQVQEQVWKELINEATDNQTNFITLDAFLKMMRKLIEN